MRYGRSGDFPVPSRTRPSARRDGRAARRQDAALAGERRSAIWCSSITAPVPSSLDSIRTTGERRDCERCQPALSRAWTRSSRRRIRDDRHARVARARPARRSATQHQVRDEAADTPSDTACGHDRSPGVRSTVGERRGEPDRDPPSYAHLPCAPTECGGSDRRVRDQRQAGSTATDASPSTRHSDRGASRRRRPRAGCTIATSANALVNTDRQGQRSRCTTSSGSVNEDRLTIARDRFTRRVR